MSPRLSPSLSQVRLRATENYHYHNHGNSSQLLATSTRYMIEVHDTYTCQSTVVT